MTDIERKESILKRLDIPMGTVLPCVFDSDTCNEIDDQYALTYLMKHTDRFDIQALYAEPFLNSRAESPKDGMEKSYDEIFRVLGYMDIVPPENFVFKGSEKYVESRENPEHCPAALDLVERAKKFSPENPLYVIATGCITNIANALLIDPDIRDNIVVCWLGGNQISLKGMKPEFNLKQDVIAAREVFSCGTAVVSSPCHGCVSQLSTDIWELEHYLAGRSKINDYLLRITREYLAGGPARNECYAWAKSKILWDVAPIAHLVNPDWFLTDVVKSPGLNDDGTYIPELYDHPMRTLTYCKRDAIMGDLFRRLTK